MSSETPSPHCPNVSRGVYLPIGPIHETTPWDDVSRVAPHLHLPRRYRRIRRQPESEAAQIKHNHSKTVLISHEHGIITHATVEERVAVGDDDMVPSPIDNRCAQTLFATCVL